MIAARALPRRRSSPGRSGTAAPNPILWDSARSMGQNEKGLRLQPLDLTGAPGEIRTPDLLVRSQTLYPTELRARLLKLAPGRARTFVASRVRSPRSVLNRCGGEGGIHGRLRRLVPCAGSAGSGSNPVSVASRVRIPRISIQFVAEREGFEPSKGRFNPLLP
jgi:hypothetical protein